MGTADLFATQQTLLQFLSPQSRLGNPAGAPAKRAGPGPGNARPHSRDAAVFGIEGPGNARAFDSVFFRRQLQTISLVQQMREAAQNVSVPQAGEAATITEQDQLTFSFFAEVRFVELTRFQELTRTTANRLGSAQQTRFVETATALAARFEVSVTLSGEALQSFARTAGRATEDRLETLMALTNQLLGEADDVLDGLLAFVSDFLGAMRDAEAGAGAISEAFSGVFNGDLAALLGTLFGEGEGTGTSAFTQLEFSFTLSIRIELSEGNIQESDPIVLDLDGDGIELTNFGEGARFDIEGSGSKVNTAFVTGGDAFLAIDRNRNGIIDDGTELFGDQNGARNGFEELRKFDTNGDGRINDQDADFGRLLLFRDNGDGRTDPGELVGLQTAGIREINLAYRDVNEAAQGGNRIGQRTLFIRDDGSSGVAADALLRFTV